MPVVRSGEKRRDGACKAAGEEGKEDAILVVAHGGALEASIMARADERRWALHDSPRETYCACSPRPSQPDASVSFDPDPLMILPPSP